MRMTEAPPVSFSFPDTLPSLGLYGGRGSGVLIGRAQALTAVEQGLSAAERSMACLALEGEPGIGKTRLLLEVEELARRKGFSVLAVTGDEEIQGPFLVARSIFTSQAAQAAARNPRAEQALERVVDALSNRDEQG